MSELCRKIDQGRGIAPADLVLKNALMFDLVTGALVETDIAICGSMIVGTFGRYEGVQEIDLKRQIVTPGFIDTHLHIESSLVTPFEFERCVLPHGVTTAICDPHEIANVAGAEGISYFLNCAEHMVMDLYVQLSSCVPSTDMETSGATLNMSDLAPFMNHPKVIGLAEFMNYPGVLHKRNDVIEKLEAFKGHHIDGHCPLLLGKDLNGYIAAGIRTEHESTTAEEALEKMRKSMHILIREGSVSKDLEALAPIITERNSPFIAFCTDDRNPLDIAEYGHIDYMIRKAIALGAEPLAVYRAASYSAARAFGLMDRGLVAPGQRADLVVMDDLKSCRPNMVFTAGHYVEPALFEKRQIISPVARQSVKAKKVAAEDFKVNADQPETHVIGILEGKIITEHLILDLPIQDKKKSASPELDIIKISVVERHGKSGKIATGFVRGFGMTNGAIASTVCHDHHNIVVVGVNDSDMAFAANRLSEIEGGFVVAQNEEVLSEVSLPVAGLMSLKSFEQIEKDLKKLRLAAQSLDVILEEPFLQLAFLALPVIPYLKITDHGLVDVSAFKIID